MTARRVAVVAAGVALVVVRWLWGIAVSEDYKAFCAELDGYRAAAAPRDGIDAVEVQREVDRLLLGNGWRRTA
jgi:hypothetical protein